MSSLLPDGLTDFCIICTWEPCPFQLLLPLKDFICGAVDPDYEAIIIGVF